MSQPLPGGIVYTETLIHSAPESLASQAPYQIAIIELDGGGRITARLSGDSVRIGDTVAFLEYQNGVPFFVSAKGAVRDTRTAAPTRVTSADGSSVLRPLPGKKSS